MRDIGSYCFIHSGRTFSQLTDCEVSLLIYVRSLFQLTASTCILVYTVHAFYVSVLISCVRTNYAFTVFVVDGCMACSARFIEHLHIPLRMSSLVGVRVCAVSFFRVCGLKTTVNMPKRAKKNEEAVEGETGNGTGTVF